MIAKCRGFTTTGLARLGNREGSNQDGYNTMVTWLKLACDNNSYGQTYVRAIGLGLERAIGTWLVNLPTSFALPRRGGPKWNCCPPLR